MEKEIKMKSFRDVFLDVFSWCARLFEEDGVYYKSKFKDTTFQSREVISALRGDHDLAQNPMYIE